MTHILVTTDLSSESTAAFPVATELAKKFGAQVTLLAVVEDPAVAALAYAIDFPIIPDPEVQKQLVIRVRKDVERLSKEHFAGLRIEPQVVESSAGVANEIINVAKARQADFIVMATHGRTGLSHLILGSVTERVLRQAPCPIITVPVGDKTVTA